MQNIGLKHIKKEKLNLLHIQDYIEFFDAQIRDKLGNKNIGDIQTSHIQKIIDEYANPSSSNEKMLAVSGLKKIIQFLNPCFKTAVKEEIIQFNPCEDVQLPSQSYIKKELNNNIP